MDKNLRQDFYNYLNKNCKLPEETEDKLLKLNLIITNSFSPQKENNIINKNEEQKNTIHNSTTYNTIQNSLNEIKITENNLKLLDNQVDMSINKL